MSPTAMSRAARATPRVASPAARRASTGPAAPARVARASARASASSLDASTSRVGVASTSSRVRDGAYAWRGHRVHFERGGCDPAVATKHVVFLHGFGVGTFHYDHQLADLGARIDAETKSEMGDEPNAATTCVWALDFVGQGASWPCDEDESDESLFPYVDEECAAPDGFRYSVDTWRDQVIYFLREIVRPKNSGGAYLAGNSLGGYVAALVAATEIMKMNDANDAPKNERHEGDVRLVKGLVLLNATPFWAFVPNDENNLSRRLAPWDGATPAPRWIRAPFKKYWDAFRSEANVKGLLSLVYGDSGKEQVDETLVKNIIAPTNRKPALSAFCSVVFSPKSEIAFDDATKIINSDPNKMPVALVYGRDDPWVVPLWGQRMKRAVPRSSYYELPGVGHCPAHEAPTQTNACIAAFVSRCEMKHHDGKDVSNVDPAARFLVDGAPHNVFEKLAAWRETRNA